MAEVVVVDRGDSLWSIANRYGVTVDELIRINEILPATPLVPGQTIIVPSNRFRTLYSPPSFHLRRAIEANAYIRANDPNAANMVNKYARYLTYFSVSSYRLTASGELTSIDDAPVLTAIQNTNAVPMLVVTNFTGEAFSPDITRALFTNDQVRETFVNNLISIINQKEYIAVNIDFEENYPEDRELYNQFLRTITPLLKEQGVLVSTTLAPKISPTEPVAWFGGLDHDYGAHGQIVDFVIIMTYDIGGWFSGPPAAVSPIQIVRQVISFAISTIPANKIMLGLPLYGYDWRLPFNPEVDFAETVGPREAVNRARERGASIQYDYNKQAPFFTYYDEEGQEHIVWFEDGRSIKAKLDLINEYNLRGVSYFILGRSFPENWALLLDMFTIEKYK